MEEENQNLDQAESAYKDMYAKLYNVPRENLEDISIEDLEQMESALVNRANKVQFQKIEAVNSEKIDKIQPEKSESVTPVPVTEIKPEVKPATEQQPPISTQSIESLPLTSNNISPAKDNTQKSFDTQVSQDTKKEVKELPSWVTEPIKKNKKEDEKIENKELQPDNISLPIKQQEENLKKQETLPQQSNTIVIQKNESKPAPQVPDITNLTEKLKAETAHLAPVPDIYKKDSTTPISTANNVSNNTSTSLPLAKPQQEQTPVTNIATTAPALEKANTSNVPTTPGQVNKPAEITTSNKKDLPDWVTMPLKKPINESQNVSVTAPTNTEKSTSITGNQPAELKANNTSVGLRSAENIQENKPVSLPLGENVTGEEKDLIQGLTSKLDAFKAFKPQGQVQTASASIPLSEPKESGAVASDKTTEQTPQPVLPKESIAKNVPITQSPATVVGASEQSLKQINEGIAELVKITNVANRELRLTLDNLRKVAEQILTTIPSLNNNTVLAMQNGGGQADSNQINTNFLNNYKNEIRQQTGSGVIDINNSRSSIPGFTI